MARSFNGSSDKITASSENPNTFLAPTVTICFWFNATSFSPLYNFMFGWSSQSGIFITSSGKLAYYMFNTGVDPGTAVASAGIWYHAAMTCVGVGTGGIKGYFNGIPDGTQAISLSPLPSYSSVLWGNDGGAEKFIGSLAETAIWSVILTPQEIKKLASGSMPYQVRSESLVGYWPLNGYDHPVLDLSLYRNNGVLTGTSFGTGPSLINPSPVPGLKPGLRRQFWPGIDALGWFPPKIIPPTIIFRRTLSPVGTRIGARQIQGWSQ